MESCAGNSWLCPPGKPWLIVVPDHRCLYFSSTRRHVLINARPSVSKIVTRYRHRPSSEIVNTTRPPASPPIPVTGIAPDTFGNNHRPWHTTRSNLKRHRHPRSPNSTTRQHDALSSCDCKSRRHPCPTIRDTSPTIVLRGTLGATHRPLRAIRIEYTSLCSALHRTLQTPCPSFRLPPSQRVSQTRNILRLPYKSPTLRYSKFRECPAVLRRSDLTFPITAYGTACLVVPCLSRV